jgi:type 1 glutamine amidotransferase
MNRRELLRRAASAAGVIGLSQLSSTFPLGWAAPANENPKRRVLMFSRSETYEHDVVKRNGDKLSLAEQIVTDLGAKHGFDVKCEKDGRVFNKEDLGKFDAFVFETQGNLMAEKSKEGAPPMTQEGKAALLDAVSGGKGFVGSHCASDTFHSKGSEIDPYIAMVGGEFITHGGQQKAWMRVIDSKFPGAEKLKDFELHEEWYALKNFADNLHVILAQDGKDMKEDYYHRPLFPATWARMHNKGRVFYTSMGHRDDVWKNELFQALLLGGLSWALGNVKVNVEPNMKEATPKANEYQQRK